MIVRTPEPIDFFDRSFDLSVGGGELGVLWTALASIDPDRMVKLLPKSIKYTPEQMERVAEDMTITLKRIIDRG